MQENNYYMINSTQAHDGPVRSMYFSEGRLISGCQSSCPLATAWIVGDYDLIGTGEPMFHDNWVTATFIIPKDVGIFKKGSMVTGCLDSLIRIFDESGNLLAKLSGHSKGVISLAWSIDDRLISGSWDGTAKIWDLNSLTCSVTMSDHENGVNVLSLQNGIIVTSSTGEAINNRPTNYRLRFWSLSGDLLSGPIMDHRGSIRSLTRIDSLNGFASSSNDGTIKVRHEDGTVMCTLQYPSEAFVLCVTSMLDPVTGSCLLVSSAEDGSVLIWDITNNNNNNNNTNNSSLLHQVIQHPCCVWCVVLLDNGDILTGGDDGIIRHFSRDMNKVNNSTTSGVHSMFETSVKEYLRKRDQGVTDEEDLKNAVNWDCRGQGEYRGQGQGQVRVFNKQGTLIAAQWEEHSESWIEIGQVTGRNESSGTINGVRYDHILPVEFETPTNGVSSLKLGYNNGENPFSAAQRFIDENMLNQSYLQQIADFISDNITNKSNNNNNNISDNYNNNNNIDYLRPKFSMFTSNYYSFDEIPDFNGKVKSKIMEFHSLEMTNPLSNEEITLVLNTLEILSDVSNFNNCHFETSQINAVISMIVKWNDSNHYFPAFDMLRIIALHRQGSKCIGTMFPQLLNIITNNIIIISNNNNNISAVLTSTRFLVNVFKSDSLNELLVQNMEFVSQILQCNNVFVNHCNKLIRGAFGYLLHNIGVLLYNRFSDMKNNDNAIVFTAMKHFAEGVNMLVEHETEFPEIVVRALIGLGSAVSNPNLTRCRVVQGVATPARLVQSLSKWSNQSEQVQKAIREILNIITY